MNSGTPVNQVWKNKFSTNGGGGGSQETGEGELCSAFCTVSNTLPGKKDRQERKQAWAKLRESLCSGSGEQPGPRYIAHEG